MKFTRPPVRVSRFLAFAPLSSRRSRESLYKCQCIQNGFQLGVSYSDGVAFPSPPTPAFPPWLPNPIVSGSSIASEVGGGGGAVAVAVAVAVATGTAVGVGVADTVTDGEGAGGRATVSGATFGIANSAGASAAGATGSVGAGEEEEDEEEEEEEEEDHRNRSLLRSWRKRWSWGSKKARRRTAVSEARSRGSYARVFLGSTSCRRSGGGAIA